MTPYPAPLPAPPSGTSSQRIARGALGLGLLALGMFTLREFLPALAWATIFAIALGPLYRRFEAGRPPGVLLPLGFTLAVALVFIAPVLLVGLQLAREGHAAAEWVHQVQQNGVPEPDLVQRVPYVAPQLHAWWQANLADPGSAKALAERVLHSAPGAMGRDLGAQVLHRLTVFTFTLVALFFLFRDGRLVLAQLRRASTRAFGPSGERVGQQIVASVHGTVNGLVLVGLGEGVLLGVVYAIAGVPHATVFGALTAVAAMVPFAAPVVFGLAALLLAAQGAVMAAAAVVVAGMVITFTADHFVRPVLIGGATRLPFLWVLLGILGGVEVWGLIGLFIGPAIMAALILMWREYAGAE